MVELSEDLQEKSFVDRINRITKDVDNKLGNVKGVVNTFKDEVNKKMRDFITPTQEKPIF